MVITRVRSQGLSFVTYEVDRIGAPYRGGDNGSAAEKAQRNLPGDHGGG